ncbi:peptidyl-prolyl cis-trans isomerase, FKBP-type domain-containing protein [Toxoplasma gondii]|uniref:peptidylprolyl isomerase n=2 Tax=Toxoplasma gondii TaxID=5811 RepID=A0A2T6IRQ3_TOXGO|nr:peptidyl-prolyl cis-trans isomerase, FKBP-type domain-containing protein [Toxoplasma gondii]PUA88023.1 peptidyl-prolyl cis-trans isomerase, FKBP-type domain-containing protein [Toxoplasma gondii TgCATBr9]
MALWGPVISLSSSSAAVSFNAEQGRLCFTGALLVPLHVKDGKDAVEPPPRVLLSVRTLRRKVASPLMVLDGRRMQARCKLLFEEDAEFSAKLLSPGHTDKWGVQLLGDSAPHPCDCCDLSEDESEEEEEEEEEVTRLEGKKRKRSAVEEVEAGEAPTLIPATSVHQTAAKQRQEQSAKEEATPAGKARKTDQGNPRFLVPTLSDPIASLPSLADQLSSSPREEETPVSKQKKLAGKTPESGSANKNAREQRVAASSSSGVPSQERHKEQPNKSSKDANASGVKDRKTQKRDEKQGAAQRSPAVEGSAQLSVGSRVSLPSGVSYEVVCLPSGGSKGKKETASPGDRVSIQYKGLLAKNLRRFDSGRIKFVLGRGEVIKGMELGVKGMQLGEARRLLIPSALGYGRRGAPPAIPPNSDLIFECRLMSLG